MLFLYCYHYCCCVQCTEHETEQTRADLGWSVRLCEALHHWTWHCSAQPPQGCSGRCWRNPGWSGSLMWMPCCHSQTCARIGQTYSLLKLCDAGSVRHYIHMFDVPSESQLHELYMICCCSAVGRMSDMLSSAQQAEALLTPQTPCMVFPCLFPLTP